MSAGIDPDDKRLRHVQFVVCYSIYHVTNHGTRKIIQGEDADATGSSVLTRFSYFNNLRNALWCFDSISKSNEARSNFGLFYE